MKRSLCCFLQIVLVAGMVGFPAYSQTIGVWFPPTPLSITSSAALPCYGVCFSLADGKVNEVSSVSPPFRIEAFRITEFGSCEGATTTPPVEVEMGKCLIFHPRFTPDEIGVFRDLIEIDWTPDNERPEDRLISQFEFLGEGVTELYIRDLTFDTFAFPDGEVINALPATFDGNEVIITATFQNLAAEFSADVFFEICHEPLTDETCEALPGDSVKSASFPPNQDVSVTYRWDTDGFAWWGWDGVNQHFGNRFIRVRVLDRTRFSGLAIIPKPVILVHGWNTDFSTWERYPAFLQSAHRDWQAFAADLETGSFVDAAKTKTIAQNAALLASQIDLVRDRLEAWHIDLVAHSLGGLIARQALHSHLESRTAKHLVTLGTPHLGTPCALLWPSASARQMRPAAVRAFNRGVSDRKGTMFAALAGNRWPWTCLPLTDRGDSTVEVSSALHGISDSIIRPTDHVGMTISVTDFRDFVLRKLAVGPGAESASRVDINGHDSEPFGPDDEFHPQLVFVGEVEIPTGTEVELPFVVPAVAELGLVFVAPASVQARLFDPHGAEIPESGARWNRTFFQELPEAGAWRISLSHTESQTLRIPLSVWIFGQALELQLETMELSATNSARLTVRLARLGVPVSGAEVTADLACCPMVRRAPWR